MNQDEFLAAVSFFDLSETEKAKHLAFFHRQANGVQEFGARQMGEWFSAAGLAPNESRLFSKIKKQPWSTAGKKAGLVRIHGKHLTDMEKAFPNLKAASNDVESIGEVLPKEIYKDVNRSYIRHIADQANWAYEAKAYDACAVMMRRLLEILLIHTFRNKKMEASIKKPDGHYHELDKIINVATSDPNLGLTQGVIKELKRCKDLGNFGAHDIVYTCKKTDIEPLILEYRKVISHLIDYAGFKS